MFRRLARTTVRLVTLGCLVLPIALGAQTFTVRRTSIGGEGGTDYLAADPATARVSRHARHGRRRGDR